MQKRRGTDPAGFRLPPLKSQKLEAEGDRPCGIPSSTTEIAEARIREARKVVGEKRPLENLTDSMSNAASTPAIGLITFSQRESLLP